uniref:PolB n=1 Tax=Motacilla cinerea parvoviridae sp. TaxID=2794518 RepID=A0A8A4XCX1_9VIRU|nr:MAG: PolB [Motacilla cinerea parvoviridae sp.]
MKDPQNMLYEKAREFLDFEKVPSSWTVSTPGTDKQSGLWSLEVTKPIKEYIGLRAKCYAIKTEDSEILKNKGIIKNAIDIENRMPLSFDSYYTALFNDEEIYVSQNFIQSKVHEISSIVQKKLALSSYDEKRMVLADKITTLPWGYKGELYADKHNCTQTSNEYTA